MPLIPKEHLDEVHDELIKARREHHRRLLVILSDDDSRLVTAALDFLYELRDFVGEDPILYTYHAFYSDGGMRRELFARGVPKDLNIEYVSYHQLDVILGRTYSLCIADLLNNLEPNDLGRLMGVVRGGGLYILLLPSQQRIFETITRFQSNLIVPGYTPDQLKRYFTQRLLKKLYEHNGIAIYDADNRYFLRKFSQEKTSDYTSREIIIPEKTRIPLKVYKLALTQDQVEVLKRFEFLYAKSLKKQVLVLTADRGRGKSSVVGIGLGWLVHRLRRAKGKCKVVVTSPSETNVQEVFRFADRVLRLYNHPVELTHSENRIVGISGKGIDISYVPPLEALKSRGDVLVVDEAAAIPVTMLFKFLERYDKIVFSTTIHGYEGAGRGFSVRFLTRLRARNDVEVIEYEMDEPIRYAKQDPIEEWIFDTLLLDAEPAQLTDEDIKAINETNLLYQVPDEKKLFLENEDELRQFVGIYIMAHYRNNPNDLGIMMEAPHHFTRIVKTPSGKVVVSLELAIEGPLGPDLSRESAKGAWLMGNIIPDRIIKHYKIVDFGELKGIRIVRIATHPQVMRRGLGSFALKHIEEEARRGGYDWIGAGFGVTEELLRFWVKNGFIPVHLSPERNPISGEYTVIVIKPLSEKAERIVNVIAREFKEKLLDTLPSPYYDLEPPVALLLLESTPNPDPPINLPLLKKARFLMYAWGDMTVENSMDVLGYLTKHYFKVSKRPELTLFQKLLLISKVLQAKSWRATLDDLQSNMSQVTAELKEIAKIFSAAFLGVNSPEEAEKFYFLRLDDVL
ncbi:MAG: tRNA(Met) cytidine acetyltransferase TmcA [Infirmifilum sp.]|jgi:tRNA(Met) cytidine acetyltransferase|uniref:tRNA(Met) cytidine acetyltransferase TmcA n=1 Tax=Infirmifilum TaxID=2856573 RepID=UPI00069A2F84|nr:GNAT family N-acetyltransferase [Infirmifilum uzonense]